MFFLLLRPIVLMQQPFSKSKKSAKMPHFNIIFLPWPSESKTMMYLNQ